MSNFSLISADSHIIEPPNLWTDYTESAYKERAPKVVRSNGKDTFVVDGRPLMGPWGACRAGKPGEVASDTVEDVYPGAWDPHARLVEQEKDGVQAEVIYPTGALRLFSIEEPGLRRASIRAYNNWIGDWCSHYPDRHKALSLIDVEDNDEAIAELRRSKKNGHVGGIITLSSGDPLEYWDERHDPLWAEAQDLEMPLHLHVISNVRQLPDFNDVLVEIFVNLTAQQAFASMIYGGIFERFPKLKIVSAENEAGWVGIMLDKMDHLILRPDRRYAHKHNIWDTGVLPSEYFRRNIAMSFIWDKSGVAVRDWIGIENLMWANDYPHADSSWPDSAHFREHLFGGVPDNERRMLEVENAAKLYGFD